MTGLHDAPTSSHWRDWEARLGSAGLISYRYLGCSSTASSPHEAVGRMRLRRDLCGAHGPHLAPLGIAMLDTAGINVDALAQVAPTRIDLCLPVPIDGVDEILVRGRVVRAGRTQMFTEALLEDAAASGRLVGWGSVSWAVTAPVPDGYRYVDPGPGVPDSPDLPPLAEVFDAARLPDGGYRIESLSDRVGTSSLHQGPIQVLVEAAARDAATAGGGGLAVRARQTGISIVRAGRIGPFTAHATVLAQTPDLVACHVELVDEGAGRATMATAHAVFDRVR
jgi:acyl-coenzyme A thioesterase PaaI-like protein